MQATHPIRTLNSGRAGLVAFAVAAILVVAVLAWAIASSFTFGTGSAVAGASAIGHQPEAAVESHYEGRAPLVLPRDRD